MRHAACSACCSIFLRIILHFTHNFVRNGWIRMVCAARTTTISMMSTQKNQLLCSLLYDVLWLPFVVAPVFWHKIYSGVLAYHYVQRAVGVIYIHHPVCGHGSQAHPTTSKKGLMTNQGQRTCCCCCAWTAEETNIHTEVLVGLNCCMMSRSGSSHRPLKRETKNQRHHIMMMTNQPSNPPTLRYINNNGCGDPVA